MNYSVVLSVSYFWWVTILCLCNHQYISSSRRPGSIAHVQDLDMKLYLLLNSSILLSLGLGRLLLGLVMTRVAIGLAELAECAVVGLVLVLPERAAI